MILELIKKAGEQKLSLTFTSSNNDIQCEVVGEDSTIWYSYSSMDAIDLFTTINDYLTSPEAFTKRLIDSVPSIKDMIDDMVIGA